jgi:hypothetical protein
MSEPRPDDELPVDDIDPDEDGDDSGNAPDDE